MNLKWFSAWNGTDQVHAAPTLKEVIQYALDHEIPATYKEHIETNINGVRSFDVPRSTVLQYLKFMKPVVKPQPKKERVKHQSSKVIISG